MKTLYAFLQFLDAAEETFGVVAVFCFLLCLSAMLASL